jgi:biopolymer transport protein ExbD
MSMSNRARRMAQHHLRNRADAQLNLIPLIDILSVMVAFLLVYSTEVEVIQNSKGIEIPQSIAQTAPKQSVVVMVTKSDLFVQGEFIASIADIRAAPGPLVEPLRAALKRPLLVGREMTEKDLAQREITIMADKAIPYDVLKRVMATCTAADYGRISLAVIQKEKPVAPGQLKPGQERCCSLPTTANTSCPGKATRRRVRASARSCACCSSCWRSSASCFPSSIPRRARPSRTSPSAWRA